MELKVDRVSINLIALITGAELEAKPLLQILDYSADETTAVKEYRCFTDWIVLLAVSLGVGHSKVFDAAVDELLMELPFEVWVTPVLVANCRHVVAILGLFFVRLATTISLFINFLITTDSLKQRLLTGKSSRFCVHISNECI